MSLSKVNTQFKNYGQYIFNDPATDFTTIKTDVFDGILNAAGKAGVTLKVPVATNAPGMLNATFTTRDSNREETPASIHKAFRSPHLYLT